MIPKLLITYVLDNIFDAVESIGRTVGMVSALQSSAANGEVGYSPQNVNYDKGS